MTKHDFSCPNCSYIFISTCDIELLGTSIVLIYQPDPEKTLHTLKANIAPEKRKKKEPCARLLYFTMITQEPYYSFIVLL